MGNILQQSIRRIADCLIGRGGEEEAFSILLGGENIVQAISCDLPGDLMLNILSRLPVKSLCRFKCVCKAWQTLVISPAFINMHFVNYSCKANTRKLLASSFTDSFSLWNFLPGWKTERFIHTFSSQTSTNEEDYDSMHLPFRPPSYPGYITIVGSSRGLVCIKFGHHDRPQPPPFVIWNPATKESRFLPPAPPRVPDVVIGYGCFTFIITYLTHLGVKFTYVSGVGDFKLVSIWHNGRGRFCADTFTLAQNSWKRNIVNLNYVGTFSQDCVLVNERLHWLGIIERDTFGGNYPDSRCIVFFYDAIHETYKYIPVPCSRTKFGYRLRRSLAVLNQSQLAMFVYQYKAKFIGEWIQIWVHGMGGWTNYSNVKLPSLSVNIRVPIGFWSINGKEEEEEEEKIIFTTFVSALGFHDTT